MTLDDVLRDGLPARAARPGSTPRCGAPNAAASRRPTRSRWTPAVLAAIPAPPGVRQRLFRRHRQRPVRSCRPASSCCRSPAPCANRARATPISCNAATPRRRVSPASTRRWPPMARSRGSTTGRCRGADPPGAGRRAGWRPMPPGTCATSSKSVAARASPWSAPPATGAHAPRQRPARTCVAAGARLHHVRLQDDAGGAAAWAHRRRARPRRRLQQVDLELGAGLSATNSMSAWKAKAPRSSPPACCSATGGGTSTPASASSTSRATPAAPCAGAGSPDSARVVFHGGITIRAGADGSRPTCRTRTCCCRATPRSTQPVLEIHADEVKTARTRPSASSIRSRCSTCARAASTPMTRAAC